MRQRFDGSVQSSNTPTPQNAGRIEDFAIYRCMVTKIIFVDDPSNITSNSQNPRVLYDCIVLGGFSSGQVISNCRLASTLGGNFNYFERTLRAASQEVSKTRLADNDGDVVYVMFNQGHTAYPVIIALDEGISTGSDTGAISSDGQILKHQYNGIYHEIDKNGDFTWIRKGGNFDSKSKVFTPANAEEVNLSVKDQDVTITLKNGMVITISGTNDKVSVTTNGGSTLDVDGTADKIEASTSGGPKVTLDGSSDKAVVDAGTIELGEGASEKVVLGDSFKSYFDGHTHPTGVGPSGPPISPMPGGALSNTVKAKS